MYGVGSSIAAPGIGPRGGDELVSGGRCPTFVVGDCKMPIWLILLLP